MAPWAFLDYFTEWGARPWRKFVEIGIRHYLGGDFANKRILEIGPGSGRISCLFALLGGQVTGLDVSGERLAEAHSTVAAFGLDRQVKLIQYSGDPADLKEQQFEVIFSKSALIYPDNLPYYLGRLNELMTPDGKFVFIENDRGNAFWQVLRFVKRRSLSFFKRTHYFTPQEATIIKEVFQTELVMRAKLPPIYLFCGKKK